MSNAALISPVDERDAAGIPLTIVVNYLAPYVLLRRIAEAFPDHPSRFVVVGAEPAGSANLEVDVDDLTYAHTDLIFPDADLQAFALYGHSKNMDVMLTYVLADRLAESSITVNGVHPGIIGQTGIMNGIPGLKEKALALFGTSSEEVPAPEKGAEAIHWVATGKEIADMTGVFFVGRSPIETAPHTTDKARLERLWRSSATLTNLEN